MRAQLVNRCGFPGTLTTIAVKRFFNIRPRGVSGTLTKCAPRGGHSRLGGATSGALVVSTCGTGPADVVTSVDGFQGVRTRGGVLVLKSVQRLNGSDTSRRRGVTSCLRRYKFGSMILMKRLFTTAHRSCRDCPSMATLVTRLRERGPYKGAVLVGKSGNVGLDSMIRCLWSCFVLNLGVG